MKGAGHLGLKETGMTIAIKSIEMSANGLTMSAQDYATAAKALMGVAHTGGGVVAFTIRFVDGKSYSGEATIAPGHARGYDLGAHVREQAETYTGSLKPAHLSKDEYLAAISKVPPAERAFLRKLLTDYDLSGAPLGAEPEPVAAETVPTTLKEARRKRLESIEVRPEVERVPPRDENDHTTDLEDGFFPPGPAKDIESYHAAPAEGFRMPTPKGTN